MYVSYANRGMALEMLVDMSNTTYRQRGIAVVDKVPTPIKIINMNQRTGRITNAVFERKSGVDYLGTYNGKSIVFDAKSTLAASFPLANVGEHQFDYLKGTFQQKACCFLLVEFAKQHETYILRFQDLEEWWKKSKDGGRKSIPYAFFKQNCKKVVSGRGIALDYLACL